MLRARTRLNTPASRSACVSWAPLAGLPDTVWTFS